VLERCLETILSSAAISDLVAAEAEAAAAYWGAWANVELRFQPADQQRIPEHWRTAGQRHSRVGSGPRMATSPAWAILNYLYALLEAEARLACQTVGLDPALAIVHADIRGRDSLPLDLIEAVRPNVDRYLLALLRDRVFQAADFHETNRGNCRLLAPLTHELAETMPAWRRLIAPIAERVASALTNSEAGSIATPLTETNRRADRARRRLNAASASVSRVPKPEPRCERCGGELPHRDRVYCDQCLPHYRREQYITYAQSGVGELAARRLAGSDPSHGGIAAQKRGATQARQRRERSQWEAANPTVQSGPQTFQRDVLPLIQRLPLSELATATGLSVPYVSQIRRGEKVPHPRHWALLEEIGREAP
jgi:hypothetical protein